MCICLQLKRCCACVCLFYKRGQGGDRCLCAFVLCKKDLRKGEVFVLSWARILRICWGVSLQNCRCWMRVLAFFVRYFEIIVYSCMHCFLVC